VLAESIPNFPSSDGPTDASAGATTAVCREHDDVSDEGVGAVVCDEDCTVEENADASEE